MKRILIHLNNLDLGRIGNATAALLVLKDLWGDKGTTLALSVITSDEQTDRAEDLCKKLGLGFTTQKIDP